MGKKQLLSSKSHKHLKALRISPLLQTAIWALQASDTRVHSTSLTGTPFPSLSQDQQPLTHTHLFCQSR